MLPALLITARNPHYHLLKMSLYGSVIFLLSNASSVVSCQIYRKMRFAVNPTQLTASAIQCMNDAGFEIRHIMHLFGHKNEASVRSYNRDCSTAQTKVISDTICGLTVPYTSCRMHTITTREESFLEPRPLQILIPFDVSIKMSPLLHPLPLRPYLCNLHIFFHLDLCQIPLSATPSLNMKNKSTKRQSKHGC